MSSKPAFLFAPPRTVEEDTRLGGANYTFMDTWCGAGRGGARAQLAARPLTAPRTLPRCAHLEGISSSVTRFPWAFQEQEGVGVPADGEDYTCVPLERACSARAHIPAPPCPPQRSW